MVWAASLGPDKVDAGHDPGLVRLRSRHDAKRDLSERLGAEMALNNFALGRQDWGDGDKILLLDVPSS